jgi:hypothetical protein
MGLSPVLVTLSRTLSLPSLIRIGSWRTTIAPGTCSSLSPFGSSDPFGNTPSAGRGKKEPYKASERSSLTEGEQIGSWTVTRKTPSGKAPSTWISCNKNGTA